VAKDLYDVNSLQSDLGLPTRAVDARRQKYTFLPAAPTMEQCSDSGSSTLNKKWQ
jgi:hypothetical protein